jgi:hypothetical protein
MESLLIDILIVIAAFWLGWKLRGFWLIISLAARPELLAEVARQAKNVADGQAEAKPRRIRVEQMGECLYLYAEDTNEFLAQGATLEAALEQIELRYPNEEFHGHIDRKQVEALGITVK